MKPVSLIALAVSGVALAAILGGAAAARAEQPAEQTASQSVPKGWNYEIRNGQRVPKTTRVTTADGGVREELRQGTCLTVKEKSPSGEFKQVTKCD